METRILKKIVMLFLLVLSIGCSKDDDVPTVVPDVTSLEIQGDWLCELGQTCEDIYQFEFKKDSKISISVENITGQSTVSLDLSLNSGQFAALNLLNDGNISYYGCANQNEEISITNISITETGVYNFSVARDWGLSAGTEGMYSISIISNTPFKDNSMVIENTQAINYERECL
ncbi:PPC domain-containing protein [Aquimarina litoralis]|uniref:PPC domain-containing protein n=1 Tax=Aquimarina litoralis TaxID=584605 RepID=UPI001C55D644|nr:PPC domain-containing protein [Aquimarina litoralis]MBW1298863.1 hypothetical protein [Aquimarina litoralis]